MARKMAMRAVPVRACALASSTVQSLAACVPGCSLFRSGALLEISWERPHGPTPLKCAEPHLCTDTAQLACNAP